MTNIKIFILQFTQKVTSRHINNRLEPSSHSVNMDENCSPPAIDQYAEKYQATLVSISTIIGVPGVSRHIPYNPQDADKMADELIELAIENFKKRHGKIRSTVPKKTQKAIAGFSTEAVFGVLGNKLDPLVEVMAFYFLFLYSILHYWFDSNTGCNA